MCSSQAEIARLKARGLEPKAVKEARPVHSYSTGVAAASFTSTSFDVVTVNENMEFSDEDMRQRIYRRVKKKNTKGCPAEILISEPSEVYCVKVCSYQDNAWRS